MHTKETSMDPGCNQVGRPKYFDIHEAVEQNLLSARMAVQKLYDDICGVEKTEKVQPEDCKTQYCSSLLSVLEQTASTINEESQAIIKTVAEIR